jgi:DNA processing protein
MMDEKLYWIGLNLARGIGPVRLQALLDHFGDLRQAWEANRSDLLSAGLQSKTVDHILELRSGFDLNEYYQKMISQGIKILTWLDEDYPARLKNIQQPPPVLYLRGDVTLQDHWAVGIVGTRRITSYGRQVTEQISTLLARNGITVVSGLARGVDGIAHQAALAAGGRTIAVLGSGVDQIYPPEHRSLAEKIAQAGAVMSDYAPGTPPEAVNFPPRNRIISGLTGATVVIEAGETSGALITASFAAEQGKEVFAVPGGIYSPQSKGTNKLILEGATPLINPEDILNALDIKKVEQYHQASLLLPADEVESRLLTALNLEPMHIDDIQASVGLPVEKISASLTMLELKGMVRQVSGMTYQAVRDNSPEYQVRGE